jgi:glutamate/aspartate transport system substrate-binding protein
MKELRLKATFALALCAVLGSSLAHAQQKDTLTKVKETGTITMGIRESSIPLSYLDDKQQPVGYHVEICTKIVDAVRKQLALPGLKLVHQPVTSQNRIPLVTNGTVDLECGSTTNNEARQKQVAFARPPSSPMSGWRSRKPPASTA